MRSRLGMPEGALLAWRAPGRQELCDPGGSGANLCPFLPGHPLPDKKRLCLHLGQCLVGKGWMQGP